MIVNGRRASAGGILLANAMILGLAVDSILTPDTVKDVKPLAEELKIPYPVAVITKQIADDYKFKGIPTCVVVDRDGKIAKVFYGYHDAKRIGEIAEKLLAKKAGDKR